MSAKERAKFKENSNQALQVSHEFLKVRFLRIEVGGY